MAHRRRLQTVAEGLVVELDQAIVRLLHASVAVPVVDEMRELRHRSVDAKRRCLATLLLSARTRRCARMPRSQWSEKRERQYEHVKESLEERGRSEKTAKRIAAATVNQTRT